MSWTYTLNDLAQLIGAKQPDQSGVFQSVSTDTRTLQPGDVFFALSGPNFDGNRFVSEAFARGALASICTEQVPGGTCLITGDPLASLQQFAAAHRRRYAIPVVAITGSCGKTTTKDMTATLLASRYNVARTHGNLNNEIGCPLSLLQIDNTTNVAVIEMGANHPGEIARLCSIASPTSAGITIIAPAHLEGFGTVENVARAKAEIIQALPPAATFYLNCDDPWCVRMAEGFSGRLVRFGKAGTDVKLEDCRPQLPDGYLLKIDPIGEICVPIRCRAHVTNVLLAVAIGLDHGITDFEGPLQKALASMTRFLIRKVGALNLIDDAYNANPASMAAALDALSDYAMRQDEALLTTKPARRVAVLGEMLELGESARELHRILGETAASVGITHLYARGPHAMDMVDAALANGVGFACAMEDHAEIAKAIQSDTQPGDWILVKGSRGMRMERVAEELAMLNGVTMERTLDH